MNWVRIAWIFVLVPGAAWASESIPFDAVVAYAECVGHQYETLRSSTDADHDVALRRALAYCKAQRSAIAQQAPLVADEVDRRLEAGLAGS